MANRRRNFRRKSIDNVEKENKYFKALIITFCIIFCVLLIVLFCIIYIEYVKNQETKNQSQKYNNEIESVFKRVDNTVNDANDYKTDTIIRMTIAGTIDMYDFEKYFSNDSLKDIENHLKNSDFTIADLKINDMQNENILTNIKNSGITMLNINNNDDEKINEFSNNLKESEIETIGSTYDNLNNNIDQNASKYCRVNIIEKKGVKISFVGYNENKESKNFYTEEKVKEDLDYAKKNSSIIVVMMNWKNTLDYAIDSQKKQAQFLADNGANLIIGNNQNNVQNMDILKGENNKDCFVSYSLGNLLSTTNIERNKSGLVLEIQILIDKDGKTSINRVDYILTYILKNKNDMAVYDLKNVITTYEKLKNDNKGALQEENLIENNSINNNNVKNEDYIISKNITQETYTKMKNAKERIEKIIKQN